jgi:hypothetical protein
MFSIKNSGTPSKAMFGAATERRHLLKRVGIGAASLAALSTLRPTRAAAQTADEDVAILNFALNLEYLEAEFYLMAVKGHGLSDADSTGTGGSPGYVNGGAKVSFANKYVKQYAEEIANDELNHVQFLRAAGVVGPNDDFNPFLNDETFLLGAFIFEDVGVTAYNGAGASITNPAYLTAATSILAVEAYHAASVRLQLLQLGLADQANKISALRAALSSAIVAGAGDDEGVTIDKKANIVPTDANSLAYARTPAQVLNIVYGGGSANGYLFYPNKMNGSIS